MSDIVQRLRELAKAATPGPWRTGYPYGRCKLDHGKGPGGHGGRQCRYTFEGWSDTGHSISRDIPYGPDDIPDDGGLIAGQWDYEAGGVCNEADARYIAAVSPDVVLALLDEIERLRKEHP